jgi:hypothetical protein
MNIKLESLSEAKKAIASLNEKTLSAQSEWSAYQIFLHCSKTIEYSMTGYPSLKPAIIRNTIGKVVVKKFLTQGYMKHDLHADVQGSPMMENAGSFDDGLKILIDSIEKFRSYTGELKPHLLFGKLSKEQYDRYFAIHIADHLSVF